MSYFDDNEDRITGIDFGKQPQGYDKRRSKMTYDNTNSGVLFENDQKGNEKAPNRKGTINVEGKEYWISAWDKTSQKGQDYISLSVQPKEDRFDEVKEAVESDSIPF